MISFLDLKKVNARFENEINSRLMQVVDSGWYIRGRENEVFSENFAKYCGVKYACGVGNGLDALRLLLMASGLGKGDEVIVPANTFIATILAISYVGCTPVLVEPDINTYNINPDLIETAITEKTKAIMVVHLYGMAVQMKKVWEIAKKYNLKVFEDAAQSHGAIYEGKRTGALSDGAAFSFYPGKNLGCLGDGGMVVSNDKYLIDKVKFLSNFGSDYKYHHIYKGLNSRLDEVQAAILDTKLPYLDSDNNRRREISKYYRDNIKNPKIILPDTYNEKAHVWHVFVVRTKERDRFQKYLSDNGIQTLIHYPTPPHKQLAYSEWNNYSYPVTEEIHDTIISLPMSPVMTDEEVQTVTEVVNNYR